MPAFRSMNLSTSSARNRTHLHEVLRYFFLRFFRLALKGPLIASSRASRARRSISARFFFGGNASGWPRFQSVILFLARRRFFFAFFATLQDGTPQAPFPSRWRADYVSSNRMSGVFWSVAGFSIIIHSGYDLLQGFDLRHSFEPVPL